MTTASEMIERLREARDWRNEVMAMPSPPGTAEMIKAAHKAVDDAVDGVLAALAQPGMVGREEIARIIDPGPWTELDRMRTLRGRIITPTDALKKRHCGASLAKADAILAAQAGGGGGPALTNEQIDQIATEMFESTSIANGGTTHGIWADYGEAGRELFRDMARVAARALRSPTAPVGERTEGWRLVPVKPTREMWTAGFDELMRVGALNEHGYLVLGSGVVAVLQVYRAMLSALPPPPERDGVDSGDTDHG